MHALEPTRTGKLRQPLGVMHVTLVHASRQYSFGMTGADALDRDAPLDQTMIQKRRQRAGLQNHPHQVGTMTV